MQLQKCTMRDVSKLALLNKQLIDDEKSNNAMNINELESRMKRFLETDYSCLGIKTGLLFGNIAGLMKLVLL